MTSNRIKCFETILLCICVMLSGCTSVNTFPKIARSGDTISVMVGGSAQARKGNVSAVLQDSSGQIFDLQALGKVRSVFNLRSDGRAIGLHYSPNLDSNISWLFGHEPLQTVMVTDLPATLAVGPATLSIAFNGVSDNSSGYTNSKVKLEIVAGTGVSDELLHKSAYGDLPVSFGSLETAPYARIGFGTGATLIGAASLVINFDNAVANANNFNVYVPESTVRDSYNSGAFGKTQRMIYWHQDGFKLYVDIVTPQGIDPRYLQFFVVHPPGLIGSPAFSILSSQVYGTDGNAIAVTPTLTYSP